MSRRSLSSPPPTPTTTNLQGDYSYLVGSFDLQTARRGLQFRYSASSVGAGCCASSLAIRISRALNLQVVNAQRACIGCSAAMRREALDESE